MSLQSKEAALWVSTTTTVQGRDRGAVTTYRSYTIMLSIAHKEHLEGSEGIRLTILTDHPDVQILQKGSLHDERISRKRWKESYLQQSPKTQSKSVIDFHLVLRAQDDLAASPLFNPEDVRHLHVLHREYLPSFSAVIKLEEVRVSNSFFPQFYRQPLQRVIFTQYISVLSTSAMRTPPHFPSGVIAQIMAYILESYSPPEHGGRLPWSNVKIIARLAQISKAWFSVLDSLWNYPLGIPSDRVPIKNLLLLADVLQAKPHLAQKFRSLAFCATSGYGSELSWAETSGAKNLSEAANIILKHCPNITRIELPIAELRTNQKSLKDLRKVQKVLIEEDGASMQIALLENILSIIEQWPDLEHFTCSHWGYLGPRIANSDAIAPFRLSSLKIRKSFMLTGQDLSYLLSNPQRRIRVVELTEIFSLTNQDYTSFFSLISSTVEELVVLGCKVKPSSNPLPEGTRALDSAISEMPLLKKAATDSALSTIKSIAGKSFDNHNDALKAGRTCSLAVHFSNFEQAVSFLNLPPVLGEDLIHKSGEELIAAVERTGWGQIKFRGEDLLADSDKRRAALVDVFQRAKKVADRRGISMKLIKWL